MKTNQKNNIIYVVCDSKYFDIYKGLKNVKHIGRENFKVKNLGWLSNDHRSVWLKRYIDAVEKFHRKIIFEMNNLEEPYYLGVIGQTWEKIKDKIENKPLAIVFLSDTGESGLIEMMYKLGHLKW